MKRKLKAPTLFDVFNHLLFIVTAFICAFPIYLIAANAFSAQADITEFGFAVFPKNFTFDAFVYLLKEPTQILKCLWSSIVYSFGGGLISVLANAMLGYAMARPEFMIAKPVKILLIITMFFSAGTIPTYIVTTTVYHMENSWLIYLIYQATAAFMVFYFRTVFKQIPQSLIESAELDGATHMQLLFRIVIPLSIPTIAVQYFLTASGRWKNYMVTLYYITDPNMYTMEYYIQLLVKNASLMYNNLVSIGVDPDNIPLDTMTFAVTFFTLIPMLLIFPFFQKKFSKGIMIGSVKG